MLAREPYPDFLLLDKLIACAIFHQIDVLLTVNKTDLRDEAFHEKIVKEYVPFFRVLFVSAEKKEGLNELKAALHGKTTCFSGQSAVGKSSILNALYPYLGLETGQLSAKTLRGKNTTRHSEIFPMGENTFLMDTPGFSLFDFTEIPSENLHLYYPEFQAYLGKCRFDMCSHRTEPDCAVKQAVAEGKISSERYFRYTEFEKELKEKEKNRY